MNCVTFNFRVGKRGQRCEEPGAVETMTLGGRNAGNAPAGNFSWAGISDGSASVPAHPAHRTRATGTRRGTA